MNNAQLINQDSGDYEYYTQAFILEAARKTMGSIDLDPASSALANQRVKAKAYYSQEGLTGNWFGNVWLNHPFAIPEYPCKSNCKKKICKKRGYCRTDYKPGNIDWINKLLKELNTGRINQVCMICYASTSEKWFRPLFDFTQCWLYPRTNYLTANDLLKSGVTKGSVVTYIGSNKQAFYDNFKGYGKVTVPYVI